MVEGMSERIVERPYRWVGLAFLGWTLVALFLGMRLYYANHLSASPITWLQAFTWSFSDVYLWAALSPIVFRASRAFRLGRGAQVRNFAIHVGLSFLLAGIHTIVYGAIVWFARPAAARELDFPEYLQQLSILKLHVSVIAYWVLVLIRHTLDYHQRFREEELRASRVETQLVQARLRALEMQLHPHFLFNTLNAIAALMHRDVDAADRMLVRLGDLLRLTLESGEMQEVPLRQELEFLGRYLEIEQTRFADRLHISMNIAPDTLDARVPNLILQPLVENAIRHGIGASAAAGEIEISSIRENGTLVLKVRDDGPGFAVTGAPLREGVGLSNTRARLAQLYGPSHEFEFTNGAEGGCQVSLRLPFEVEDPDEPEEVDVD
jgi:hypothetical protein